LQTIFSCSLGTMIPLISASWVARITGHSKPFWWWIFFKVVSCELFAWVFRKP
jgi:hypothetical protein